MEENVNNLFKGFAFDRQVRDGALLVKHEQPDSPIRFFPLFGTGNLESIVISGRGARVMF